MFKPARIMVPTDFSRSSDKALKQALDIAAQYRSHIFLVHVIHGEITQCVYDYCISSEEVKKAEEQLTTAARKNLEKQLAKFPAAKQVKVSPLIRRGHPSEELLKTEKKERIDLIVIASLGQTRLLKYLIGSIARNVLKGAKCPVLLTR